MIPLTATGATPSELAMPSLWTTAVYAGVLTAVAGVAMVLLFGVPFLWPLAGLLVGAGPVLGYDLARGQLGANWRPLIGGVIGYVFFLLGWVPFVAPLAAFAVPVLVVVAILLSTILWPIVVGAMSPHHSIGRLFLGSLIGLLLGLAVTFLVVAPMMGQNPGWVGTGAVIFVSVWAGSVGAVMAAWGK